MGTTVDNDKINVQLSSVGGGKIGGLGASGGSDKTGGSGAVGGLGDEGMSLNRDDFRASFVVFMFFLKI